MTNREREYADAGFESCEGIEQASVVIVPSTGREVRQVSPGLWECQPWNDNYWKSFTDLLEALKFASRPKPVTVAEEEAEENETIQVRLTERGNGFGGEVHKFYDSDGEFRAIRVTNRGCIQTAQWQSNYIECDAVDVTGEYDSDETDDSDLSNCDVKIL